MHYRHRLSACQIKSKVRLKFYDLGALNVACTGKDRISRATFHQSEAMQARQAACMRKHACRYLSDLQYGGEVYMGNTVTVVLL